MNVVLTDHSEQPDPTPHRLSLEFLARDDSLNPRWQPGYRRFDWTEIPAPAFSHLDEPLRVSFVLTSLSDYARTLRTAAHHLTRTFAQVTVGPGRYNWDGNGLWLIEPNTVSWTDMPLSRSGSYDLWLQLRHSERGPAETELCSCYRVEVDGIARQLDWPELSVWHTGNGYFGWAKAPLGRLDAGPHTLAVTTTHTWCALRDRIYVSRDPGFTP